jgi:hypothetical protein
VNLGIKSPLLCQIELRGQPLDRPTRRPPVNHRFYFLAGSAYRGAEVGPAILSRVVIGHPTAMLELVRLIPALALRPRVHGRTTRVGRSGESRLLLDAARAFVDDESRNNVELVEDDLFASALEPASFDLVHARFLLAPLGRFEEQIAVFRRMVKWGSLLVLEDPTCRPGGSTPTPPRRTG